MEDKIGKEVQALPKPGLAGALSEAQHHFADPRTLDVLEIEEGKAQEPLAVGLESTLLFGHCEQGNVHIPSSEGRFHTTHKMSFASRVTPNIRDGTLARRRQMELERDELQHSSFTTYTKASMQPFQPQATAKGKALTVRYSSDQAFTQSFVQAQQFEALRKDSIY